MSQRHSRQTLFEGIGAAGQERIDRANVAIVGCGALGTVAAELLVRAGVSRLTLIDRDVVELSNLQRQSLFTERDAASAREKAVAASEALTQIDSGVEIRALVEDLVPRNAERLLAGHDLIVDATDNFAARFLVNDVAFKLNIPWIYGAAVGAEGTFGLFRPGLTPCFRCLMENLPPAGSTPTCETSGVIGPVTHLVASLQVAEALKLLVGANSMRGIGLVSLWSPAGPSVRTVLAGAERWPACPTCALANYPALAGEGAEFAQSLCGRNSVQLVPESKRSIDLDAVALRLARAGHVTRNAESLTAAFDDTSITLFGDGRAIVTGTLDPERGRALFSRYVGV
ncbi:MAG: ThiF family adenylyltransferase [Thermoanaerobaculia bacterium]